MVAELRNYLPGWKQYFRLAETPRIFGDLDEWIRHRLRALQLKQWKRGSTIYRELRRLGLPDAIAAQAARVNRRWWHRAAMYGPRRSLPATSTASESRGLPLNLNLPNRRMRTRMSGGVAGE